MQLRRINRCFLLFNNKDILIGGKAFFKKEWFSRRIISITDLLEGRFLSFNDFQSKYRLRRTNFLQFYQVINAIPKHRVLAKSNNKRLFEAESNDFVLDPTSFCLESGVKLDLTKMKSKDFYWLLINKTYMNEQTGVKRWNEVMFMEKNAWRTIFSSVRTTCKETKLREFQFKFLHRIIVTKKELF